MSEDLDDIVDNLREPSSWIRILFMAGFALVLYLIIAPIVLVLMIVQALFSVLGGESNFNLRRFGGALGQYVYQILQFLTYNSHHKPFPFSDFPPMEDDEEAADKASEEKSVSKDKPASKSASKKSGSTRKKTSSKKTASKKSPASKSASPDAGSDSKGGGTAADKDADRKDTGSQ